MKDVRFTEEMSGWYAPRAEAYEGGYHTGRLDGNVLGFHLTIGTDDLPAMLQDPQHRAAAVGTVSCPTVGDGPLPVEGGEFQLFSPGTAPGRLAMRYWLPFHGRDGSPYVLSGFKDVAHDRPRDLWPDTTTLFTRLLRGAATEDADGAAPEEVGRGILTLDAAMFARQITTFRGRPAMVARFSWNFLANLTRVYAHRIESPVPA